VRSVWLVDKKNSGKWYFSNIKAVTEKNDQASQEGGYRSCFATGVKLEQFL
jgi:hypothetical protein